MRRTPTSMSNLLDLAGKWTLPLSLGPLEQHMEGCLRVREPTAHTQAHAAHTGWARGSPGRPIGLTEPSEGLHVPGHKGKPGQDKGRGHHRAAKMPVHSL